MHGFTGSGVRVSIHDFEQKRDIGFIFLISTHPDNFISPFLSLYKCSHRGSQKRSGRIQERSKKGGISDKNGVAVT